MLQGVMVVLFAITFGWIALAASSAVAGTLFGGSGRRAKGDSIPEQRTALVMPVYNEDPSRTVASLRAMAEALIAAGQSANFEIFVLSDTQNPDVYVQETAAVQTLRDALGEFRVWYRHRHENVAKKAGNLRDFVTRWGGRYDYMIVLDADSVLSVDTLLTLVREMAADPKLGLLQTVPRLCGGTGCAFQQFASRLYGPWSRVVSLHRQDRATTGATTRSSACVPVPSAAACRRCVGASPSAARSSRTTSSKRRSCGAPAGRCAC